MSVQTVVLGTQNKDKLSELKRLMRGTPVRVLSLSDFPKSPSVREDGKTFEENAEKKARVYSKRTRSLVLADDSGLEVKALGGEPGVYSARYAGPRCSYSDNNQKLLSRLRGVSWPKRLARFVSVIAIYDNGRKVATVRGECEGKIGYLEKGRNGFGYDPVFIPKGTGKTYAELPSTKKNALSHRGKALRLARKALLRHLNRQRLYRSR
jgi:non-canonical purine NTP pyrophosphatase (RdgB/HAM1 family)